jgi:hypothetical protein
MDASFGGGAVSAIQQIETDAESWLTCDSNILWKTILLCSDTILAMDNRKCFLRHHKRMERGRLTHRFASCRLRYAELDFNSALAVGVIQPADVRLQEVYFQ